MLAAAGNASAPGHLAGRNCRLSLDEPLIMGVLNITPDSFSDGGRYDSLDAARRQGARMLAEGADLIDIGGESTRPGAPAVSETEELDRVLPVIEALRREIDIPLSIDTTKAAVARAAIAAGVDFVNDISGLHFDEKMAATVSAGGAGLFVMHTRGRPERMQRNTGYGDLLGDILVYLRNSLERAMAAGIPEEKLAVDPGIGFGKDAAGNLEILRRLDELQALGRPILLGTSRKNFIGRVLGQSDPGQRLYGTLATVALGVARGAHLFRVHEVRPAKETARMAWAVCRGGFSQ
ncbi:MAG: dihydropteroate synthase [Desulfuromonadales bacterium]|jgi:dihydropteroate synthase